MWTTIRSRLTEVFSTDAIIAWAAARTPDVVAAIATFIAFWVMWKLVERTVGFVLRSTHLDETARRFVTTLLRYAILTIGMVTALSQVGINTGSILASLGVLGLTIGFAAQDTLSNIISGLFIFWDRPFVIGDLVEIGSSYGRVEEITMRSTRVVTPDGKMLAIPNREIVNSTVASYTNFPNLRLDVPVTVGVDESIDKVRKLLLAIVTDDPTYLPEPAPRVVVSALNDYNLELIFQVWIHDERDHIALRFNLREGMYRALYNAGIDMPYQRVTLDVHNVSEAS